jgi:hypothetical protein
MSEARKLARQNADLIRARVDGKSSDEALKEFRTIAKDNPSWGSQIRLENVARKVPKPDTQQRLSKEYEPYKVPREDIPYPPENFVDQLIELGEGKAKVIPDRSGKHWYVVYVEKRPPAPKPDQIVAGRRSGDDLWTEATAKQKKEYQEAILRELRREAGKLNPQGRFELRPGIRPDESGSDRDSYNDRE